jgi:RNA polymerase sigma-70 factor (ECF subfamily)
MDPDLDLLEAWRAGDRKAAGSLLERHYKTIRAAVVTKIPEEEVNDTIQKVYLALMESRDKFRGDALFKTYLMRVTRNVIADFYRHRRPTTPLDALEVSVSDHGVGLSTLLANEQHQRLALEALRNISLNDQFIIELHYWEKMTGPELAQVFECSESSIRGRLRRARERLKAAAQKIAEEHRELADTLTNLDAWAMRLRAALEPEFRRLPPR